MRLRGLAVKGLVGAARWLVSAGGTPAYNSGGYGVAVKDWLPSSQGINSLLEGSGVRLRAQARDLERRNPYAKNAVDSYVGNVIGTGIVPTFQHPDATIRKTLEDAWAAWVDEADADGRSDFYGLQKLCVRTEFIAGEVLCRLRSRRPDDGLSVPFQLQLLEPEHLPIEKNESVGNNEIRWGIEFNRIGQRVAYHLYAEHPGERRVFWDRIDTRRVPATEVLHIFEALRPGQQRGQTRFAAVMLALYELEKYDRAELVRKALAALVAFFEEDMEGSQVETLNTGEETDENDRPLTGIEPGSYVRVPMGKRVQMSQPADVGGMYPEFMRIQLRKAAVGCGITAEMLTGNLSDLNYSSMRGGLLEFRRRAEAYQFQVVVFQFCRPVANRWLDHCAMVGIIDPSDYAVNRRLYRDIEWQPPAWPWVDPLKDIQAEKMAVDELFKSRTQVIKQSGYSPEKVDEQIKRDQEREERLGLKRRAKTGEVIEDPDEAERREVERDAA